MKARLLLLLLISGCATVPGPVPEPVPEIAPETEPAPPPRESIAIAGLMETARTDVAAGRLPNAAASIERALRIEPRNPRLWQELARVRLRQGEYAQAESLAARSNSWAGSDNALRAANWRLIAEARSARGDADGAHAALEAAKRVER
jgi:predicted Zn-dependent protease